MCEFSEKLIAWLDQELPAEDAGNVGLHIDACVECRAQIELYRRLNEIIDSYCDRALTLEPKHRSSRRMQRRVFTATAAAVAAGVLLLVLLRADFSPAPAGAPAIAFKAPVVPPPTLQKTATAVVLRDKPRRINTRHPQSGSVSQTVSPNRNADWFPNEAPVYVAIPADALFPPGAFPEGVGFVADVNLRPDGSAQRLRLQPQLVGFQTRGTRP